MVFGLFNSRSRSSTSSTNTTDTDTSSVADYSVGDGDRRIYSFADSDNVHLNFEEIDGGAIEQSYDFARQVSQDATAAVTSAFSNLARGQVENTSNDTTKFFNSASTLALIAGASIVAVTVFRRK